MYVVVIGQKELEEQKVTEKVEIRLECSDPCCLPGSCIDNRSDNK
jgi:hypothetical protein